MGNYTDLECEFIERSIALIEQYESIRPQFAFEKQYNHTLFVNCLLGLIVMPKQRAISYIPKMRLTAEVRTKIGLKNSWVNHEIKNLKDLIIKLRHSIAHFDISVKSRDETFLIDEIWFKDNGDEIVRMDSSEALPFIKYYSQLLLQNLKRHRAVSKS